VVRAVNGYSAPLPSGTRDLDVIALVYVYHDLYLSQLGEFDHQSMLRSLLAALKPGGRVIVVDHMATEGMRGPSVADDLHRIDAALVKEDFEKAGFEFDGGATFMRNREDPRTEPFFRMEEPTDTLVYRFVKPK
jgi:predicted methyltransferase